MFEENFDKEADEQYSSDGAICPYCGYINKPDEDCYELYDDGTENFTCHYCGKDFNVSLYTSYSWTTTKKEGVENETI